MRGLSNFDARHRLVFSYVWELPFGQGHRFGGNASGVGGWFVSGWEISGISTFQSGRPLTVRIRGDNSLTGASTSDRPNLIGNPVLPSSQRSVNQWFNTAAFERPARGTFGNAGRSILIGPGLNNTGFSLIKNSHFGEDLNVQFRAEFFNIVNHPNFDMPNRDFGTAQFGKIFSAEQTQPSRQNQLGFKFIF